MTSITETEQTTGVAITRLAGYGLAAAIAACIVNGFVRIVAVSLFGVPTGFEPLGWVPVVNTTVVGVAGATVVYGLLTRVSNRPNWAFAGVAAVVLLLSFVPVVAPPSFLADAPGTVLVTLAVMHVTTALVAVGVLVTANTPRRPS